MARITLEPKSEQSGLVTIEIETDKSMWPKSREFPALEHFRGVGALRQDGYDVPKLGVGSVCILPTR